MSFGLSESFASLGYGLLEFFRSEQFNLPVKPQHDATSIMYGLRIIVEDIRWRHFV
jgi:hypothetical protein